MTTLSDFHSPPLESILTELDVAPGDGLSAEETRRRIGRFGPNVLRRAKKTSAWEILGRQFTSLIVLFLGAAIVVSIIGGDQLEALAIGVVIVLNGIIGFVTELQAIRSMEALRALGSVTATVRRDGRVSTVPADELVPGDVVLVDGGDVVTADLRLVTASKLQVNESTLTGESVPVDKSVESVPPTTPLAERKNMLYKGTAVTRGSASAVVVATGMETELGKISALVEGSLDAEKTPLEERLDQLGRSLIVLTLLVTAVIALSGFLAGREAILMLKTGIALAVAAVPEGLPIVATLALARGMWRMARKNVLINRLAAVETLGSTDLICTDKTGTLTEGRMTVSSLVTATGETDVRTGGEKARLDIDSDAALRALLEVAVLCNDASLSESDAIGDPLEVALLEVGREAGLDREALLRASPETKEVAFDPEVKMMATYHEAANGTRVAVKGAPEAVLEACSAVRLAEGGSVSTDVSDWIRRNEELAKRGLRVIAFAETYVEDDDDAEPFENLCLLGFAGLVDPARADVRSALRACRGAGIRVVMLTGDQVPTARYVGREAGLVDDDGAVVIEGSSVRAPEELDEETRRELLAAPLFARVTPAQKLELVRLYQGAGHIVAMTGDGVNDAPALKRADIGIAMGLRGTQVAREAADMILKDDAFSSIVAAVEQGRVIFDNIRTFIRYLVSCNVSEILVVFVGSIAGLPLPLLPLQILYLNLVTDVFPALALGFGEGHDSVMRESPRDPAEPILTRRHWMGLAAYGAAIAASVLTGFGIALYALGSSEAEATTVSFLTLAMAQLWHVFNMRGRDTGLLDNTVVRNRYVWAALLLCLLLLVAALYLPGLDRALGTSPPGADGLALAFVMSTLPLLGGQALLWWRGRLFRSARPC